MKLRRLDAESNSWIDMGEGSLRLMLNSSNPKSSPWIILRNLTGRIVFTAVIQPSQAFSLHKKSIIFATIWSDKKDSPAKATRFLIKPPEEKLNDSLEQLERLRQREF